MAKLKDYNGHYCESDYENAFLCLLEKADWTYTPGSKIARKSKHDVLIEADFKTFLSDANPDLTDDEVTQIYDTVRLAGGESDFATLHKVYSWMVYGIQFIPHDDLAWMISLINFDEPGKNIFRAV